MTLSTVPRTAAAPVPGPPSAPPADLATGTRGVTATEVATRTWTGPDGIAPRGTVVVLVGRGETPEVYERLGRRLAADAYRVVAVDDDPGAPDALAALLAEPALPRPHVLLGSDTGALTAVDAVRAATVHPDAVVLAGLPTRPAPARGPWGGTWQTEIEARTACPNHRGVLDRAARGGLDHGARPVATTPPDLVTAPAVPSAPEPIGVPVPAGVPEPASPAGAPRLGVPALALHGAADAISPVAEAHRVYRALGATQVAVVEGGLHDVLNDVQHRSVAATLVLFLERLRLSSALPVVVRTGAEA